MLPYGKSRLDTVHSSLIANGTTFHMLRDDLIHPIVCGNKWRKLKYIIQHAIDNKINNLVSFGGAYSNHLVALAHAGKTFGLRTFGFIRGEEEVELNNYKKTCIENGMILIPVSRADYKDKASLYQQHFGNSNDSIFINEGGDHPLAFKGIAEIFEDIGGSFDNIILSLGTGTTMQGLLIEAEKRNLKTKIIGISSLKNNHYLEERMTGVKYKNWEIHHNFHRGKYAKNDLILSEFIAQFHDETGIETEFVYTAKMLMAFDELIKSKVIDGESKNCCIHTGGLLSFNKTNY